MSIPEEVARLRVIADALPVGALEKLSQAEPPAEWLAARNALLDGVNVTSVCGPTQHAAEADASASQAAAYLDQAAQAYQTVKSFLDDAYRAAGHAQALTRQAAFYHERGR